MITIEIVTPDDWMRWRDMRLSALTDSPQAFCSSLSEWEHQGEQGWRAYLAGHSVNFIAVLDDRDAGMVSAVVEDQDVELLSLWVAPFARGKRVGDELVRSVVNWTDHQQRTRLILRVLNGNSQATALYERHGFTFNPHQGSSGNPPSTDRLMVRVES